MIRRSNFLRLASIHVAGASGRGEKRDALVSFELVIDDECILFTAEAAQWKIYQNPIRLHLHRITNFQ